MRIQASIMENPLFITVGLVVIFGLIVLGVVLIKRYVKPFKSDDKPKSDKEIAEEELNRVLMDVTDEKTLEEMKKAARMLEKDSQVKETPSETEIAEEEVKRATEEVADEKTAKAMARYAEEHPEEAAIFEEEGKKEKAEASAESNKDE